MYSPFLINLHLQIGHSTGVFETIANPFGKSFEKGDEQTGHSTQKPLECMARPIRNNSIENDGVYDPFGGSGTTLIACEQLKPFSNCSTACLTLFIINSYSDKQYLTMLST